MSARGCHNCKHIADPHNLCEARGCGILKEGQPGWVSDLPGPTEATPAPSNAAWTGTVSFTAGYPDDNPKTALGIVKAPLGLIPETARAWVAAAFADGQKKYGRANWRDKPVTVSTYINAAMRHMDLYVAGEETAEDSGVHHLAHAAACLMIVIDAETCGTLNDDRPTPAPLGPLYERISALLKDKMNG